MSHGEYKWDTSLENVWVNTKEKDCLTYNRIEMINWSMWINKQKTILYLLWNDY